jgi:DNA-binding MarR family transcriptional regulator
MRTARAQDDGVAVRLTVAIGRLRTRLLKEAGVDATGLSIAQLGILRRLLDDGPTTAAALAATEHVSQQAIAQSLAGLRSAGLVSATPDPSDGRKSLLDATRAGGDLVRSIVRSRDAWLVRAIEGTTSAEERGDVDRAIELLERLAAFDPTGRGR